MPPWLDSPQFALLTWVALEGWLIAATGSTPGKALMGVVVRGKDGARLDERRAWLRAAAVPLGLLLLSLNPVLGFLALLVLVFALMRLRAGLPTWWDAATRSEVTVGEFGQGRRLLAGAIVGALLINESSNLAPAGIAVESGLPSALLPYPRNRTVPGVGW